MLTLFSAGLKIYNKWWGGGLFSPPIFSWKMAFFGSKNDKTILPYIFEDVTECLKPMRPLKNLLFENTENLPKNW